MQSVPRACQLPHLSSTLSPLFSFSIPPFHLYVFFFLHPATFYLAAKGKSITERETLVEVIHFFTTYIYLALCCIVGDWFSFCDKTYSWQLWHMQHNDPSEVSVFSPVPDHLLSFPLRQACSYISKNLTSPFRKRKGAELRLRGYWRENSMCDSTVPFLSIPSSFLPSTS